MKASVQQAEQTCKDKMQWALTRGLLPATAEMVLFHQVWGALENFILLRGDSSHLPPHPPPHTLYKALL